MEYLKQLKNAFTFGGLVLGISLLNNLGIDNFGVLAAVGSFLMLAVHDLGKKYIELTNQTDTVKYAFGMVVNTFTAIICTASIFYVIVGEMVWYFWGCAFFFGLILFALDATALLEEVKKSKN